MAFLTAGPIASLSSLALLALVLVGWLGIGHLLIRFSGLDTALTVPERMLFSMAAGCILMSLIVLAVGLFGHLSAVVLCGVVVTSALASTGCPRLYLTALRPHGPLWFWVPVVAACGLSVVQALAPPIGTDALSYHLGHPRLFIETGRIAWIPDSRESLWPYLTEMFFTLGLGLQGTTAATLFHWVFYPLTAWAIYLFSKRYATLRRARLATFVFLFTPVAFAQAGHAYIDLTLTFYTFMALYAVMAVPVPHRDGPAFIAGFICGGALAVKYLGIGVFVCLFALLAYLHSKVRVWTFYVVGVLTASGVWYIRSLIELGNPVFPFMSKLFGSGYESELGKYVGMGKDFGSLIRLGWNITLHPTAFGGEILGPLFLAFAPLALGELRKRSHHVWGALIFVVVYTFFIFTQSQQVRFFLSAVPFYCLAVAAGYEWAEKQGAALRVLVRGIFVGILMLHMGIYVYRVRDAWPVVLGQRDAKEYLLEHERSFEGYQWLARNTKPGHRVFNSADHKFFYSELSGMQINNRLFRQSLESRYTSLWEYLLKESYEYLWLLKGQNEELFEFAEQNGYHPVHSYSRHEGGMEFRYVIYKREG